MGNLPQPNSLYRLVLTAQRQLSDQDVLAMAQNLTRLQQLDIVGTRHVTFVSIRMLLESAHALELLDIEFCEELEDGDALQSLRHKYPSCRIINGFP